MASQSPLLAQRKVTWVVELGDIPAHKFAPYERHVNHSKYEREDVQKKTFAKWINSQLEKNDKPLVQDLVAELRDGEVLLSLLEILTAQQYKRERGRMRVHQINNVNTALQVLDANGVKLVNISSNDIVDGNPKLILGLVWSIILHWQVQYHLRELMTETQQTNLEKTLLAWCRTHTQNYPGVNVRNFTSSWSDGLAFNALLHRWRPHLFNFNDLAESSPAQRLEHAFHLANRHLGIPRLLDPEDVNTPSPDKKSIMMYLMCVFQSVARGGEDAAPAAGEGESEAGEAGETEATEGGCGGRPLSSGTGASVEVGGYSLALEEALACLLEAEERLQACPPLPTDLPALKERFHQHERFLLELSEAQTLVGGVLEGGARLLGSGGLTREEAAEVRLQARLLNQRWDSLRHAAMAAQHQLHHTLMHTQREHLQTFRQWLTATEDRMSRMGRLSGAPHAVHAQLHALQALHADLRRHQPTVDALADCVVVVDDQAEPDHTVTEIEDELTALGERWTHTCQWTLQQLQRLQDLQARCTQLDQQHATLLQDIDALEAELKQMEANPVGSVGEVPERCAALTRVRGELSRQRAAAGEHAARVQELLVDCDDRADRAGLVDRADALHDRLDALHLILTVQADRIKELGFEFEIPPEDRSETEPPRGASKKPRLSDPTVQQTTQPEPEPDDFETWAEQSLQEIERDRPIDSKS
ncbi:unnamed protein product [Diatraea saccharalis]|uniref:Calponin-homology (CH) domain-containing protein n=1 Tax=Diatraea saccharalis TaxID=40085 RepID=A0A9N9RB64_9NEOP|nr:unnamed protein product [Diatraea saccharalis]